MKKFIVIFSFSLFLILNVEAQGFKGLIKKVTTDTSMASITEAVNAVTGNHKDNLSTSTIADGLKEALRVGTEKGTVKLASPDGFFADAAIKILMPEEAKKVEQRLRS